MPGIPSIIRSASLLAGIYSTVATAGGNGKKAPVYAIANNVASANAVNDAIADGANAIKIDASAVQGQGWFAGSDKTGNNETESAQDILQAIADQRQNGKDVPFVWLNVTNPDECADLSESCSIEGLRQLGREILIPEEVKVLFGFHDQVDSEAFGRIASSLDKDEAITLYGETGDVLKLYDGPAEIVPESQRILDYGNADLEKDYGECNEESHFTCTELKKAGRVRDDGGKLGKVFGWASTEGQANLVEGLLQSARVNGLIYGPKDGVYKSSPATKSAAQDIIGWVKSRSDSARLAEQGDW